MPDELATRSVTAADLDRLTAFHDLVFGPGAYARSAYRVREGAAAFSRFCLLTERGGAIIASVRLTEIEIGGRPGALLLGPLAVEPALSGLGHGKALVALALERAKADAIRLVVLVGDEPYYARFGFVRVPPGQILLPGPVDPRRLLAAELVPGALAEYRGMVRARPTA